MPFPLAALAPVFGAVIGAVSDYIGGGRQMRFQERMSSTAYQRAVEDMRRAGLNPALAYSQGGASTPSGAEWSPGGDIAQAASSAGRLAQESKLVKAEVAQRDATTKQLQAVTEKTEKESKILDENLDIQKANRWERQAELETARLAYEKGDFQKSYLAGLRSRWLDAGRKEVGLELDRMSTQEAEYDAELYRELNRFFKGKEDVSWSQMLKFLPWLLKQGSSARRAQ